MSGDALVEGVSGAIGGIVATVATYPLMTMNTLQATRVKASQQQAVTPPPRLPPADEEQGEAAAKRHAALTRAADAQAAAAAAAGKRQSTLQEMVELVQIGGWGALFRGIQASLVGTTVSQAVYYYWYTILRQLAVQRRAVALGRQLLDAQALRTANITVGESLLVAAAAGCINVLATNPIWLLATRMQASQRIGQRYKQEGVGQPRVGVLQVAREVLHEYGPLGFWNGVGASLLMVINPTIQYALYEYLLTLRSALRRKQQAGRAPGRPGALEVFLLSALAKAGATVLTYPMLTIKTRMMAARKGDADMQYTSIADAVQQIVQKEGLTGYYKGMRTKLLQSILAASLLFVAKEQITDFTRSVLLAKAVPQQQLPKALA